MPQFGQLTQGSMQPHIDYMRSLAVRFSGETNVSLSELGVVSDNPSSAEAIYAAKEALVAAATSGTGIDLPTANPAAAAGALLGGTR